LTRILPIDLPLENFFLHSQFLPVILGKKLGPIRRNSFVICISNIHLQGLKNCLFLLLITLGILNLLHETNDNLKNLDGLAPFYQPIAFYNLKNLDGLAPFYQQIAFYNLKNLDGLAPFYQPTAFYNLKNLDGLAPFYQPIAFYNLKNLDGLAQF
jgi:hypothetical protein